MKAFIKTDKNLEWNSKHSFLVSKELHNRGYYIFKVALDNYFTSQDSLFFEKTDVVFGSINMVKNALDFLKIPYEGYATIPECLNDPMFLNRNVEITTLHKAINQSDKKIFIKPYTDQKLFRSFLLDERQNLLSLSHLRERDWNNILVLVSEPVNILSEYRCYVFNKKIVWADCYTGDFRLNPDWKLIEKMVCAYRNSPISYSLDVGINSEGTFLIESNDGHSIGGYGINPNLYTKMVVSRWYELTGEDYKLFSE